MVAIQFFSATCWRFILEIFVIHIKNVINIFKQYLVILNVNFNSYKKIIVNIKDWIGLIIKNG